MYAFEIFNTERMNATRDSFLEKLFGSENCLISFPEKTARYISNRKFLGLRDIPIEMIIGTLGRNCDFDRKFRPLKKNLRDRWINLFTNLEIENWPPIRLHKIGANYYVEDGHHRISVARSIGMAFISAEVWEYSSNSSQPKNLQSQICSRESHSVEPCLQ
jgi:hypothetical protein